MLRDKGRRHHEGGGNRHAQGQDQEICEIGGHFYSFYPPLEGEGRRKAAGWGDGLSTSDSARVARSPRHAFASLMRVDPPPEGEGEGQHQIRFMFTETFGPFRMVW